MKKNAMIFFAAAVIALASGIAVQRLTAAASEPQTLPEAVLPDTADVQHTLSEWKGKVLIINFWATWCPPCRQEMPEFVRLQEEYGDKGLQFVGIAIEEKDPVEKFARSLGVNYPILIDEANGVELSVQMGNIIGALPYSVVVDRSGKIVYTHPGLFLREQVLEIVSPLL